MKTPHKHAELIKAWADGAEIEFRIPENGRLSYPWSPATRPEWHEGLEYRIKPEPKPDVVGYTNVYENNLSNGYHSSKKLADIWALDRKGCLKLVFDGETGLLKSVEIVK